MAGGSRHGHSRLQRLVAQGEGAKLEFKEGLGFDPATGANNPKISHAILKTVAAFLNTKGGTLLIGVADAGQIRGVEREYAFLGKKNADGFELRLRDLLHSHLKPPPLSSIRVSFETLPEGTVCRVDVSPSAQVVHVNERDVYVRDGNSTRKLDGRELTDWMSQRTPRRRGRIFAFAAVVVSSAMLGYVILKPAVARPTKPPRPGVEEPLMPCALPTPPPESLQARLAYSDGCQKTSLLDYPSARTLFERAAAVEPQNPAIRLALADTWSWLGYDERANQECKRAVELSKDLSPEPALWVHGKCYEIDNNFDQAITTYRALWALSPEKLEYGLQLVYVQIDAENGQSATTTIDKLKMLPRPARNDPRIDLAEAQVADLFDDASDSEQQHKPPSTSAKHHSNDCFLPKRSGGSAWHIGISVNPQRPEQH